jgi:hypothetical protein
MDILQFEPPKTPRKLRRRPRFSIASLLGLISACAAALAFWHLYIREAPTDRIPLYEKARGTTRGSLKVGPNVVRLNLMSRNDRDGSIQCRNNEGADVAASTGAQQSLKAPAAWLDVVQVELEPAELVDVIEARIFNHETRELVSSPDAPFGWRVTAPNTVQIYGLGKTLPPKLDVWFRAGSFPSGKQAVNLAPTSGASCQLPGGVLTLEDIRTGSWSFNGQNFAAPARPADPELAAILRWDGGLSDEQYEIAAITKDDERLHTETFHFLSFSSRGDSKRIINFPRPLEEIDHFELRPFGGRHTFFFDGVALPADSNQAFSAPPTATVPINGKRTSATLSTLAPLQVKVEVAQDSKFTGVMAGSMGARYVRQVHPQNVSDSFSVAYQVNGLARRRPQFQFIGVSGKRLRLAQLNQLHSSGEASSAQSAAGYDTFYRNTLDDVQAVEVTLPQ